MPTVASDGCGTLDVFRQNSLEELTPQPLDTTGDSLSLCRGSPQVRKRVTSIRQSVLELTTVSFGTLPVTWLPSRCSLTCKLHIVELARAQRLIPEARFRLQKHRQK